MLISTYMYVCTACTQAQTRPRRGTNTPSQVVHSTLYNEAIASSYTLVRALAVNICMNNEIAFCV